MSDELLDIAAKVVADVRGDEQIEVVVVRDLDTEVRAYEGEVESLSSAQSQGIGVRVIDRHRQGFAYAGSFDDDVVAETLAEARNNVEFGTVDEALGLAVDDGVDPAELDLYRDDLASVAPDRKVDLAIELEAAVRSADDRISGIESAEYVDSVSESAVVTSTGISAASRETSCYLSAFALAEAAGETQTGFGFSVGRHPDDLDVASAATDAAERATRLLGAVKPGSERVTVVLDPFVTAQFVGILGATLSGEAVLKGRSLFADRLGDTVAAPAISLVDDPTNSDAFTATKTDGEGLATRRNQLIERGQLAMFVHNTYTARRLGAASTGSAVRSYASTPSVGCMALALAPGARSQAELIADIDDGVLIQGVSGLHSGVNPVSGDFSTGAEGLRIRNGAPAEPLREFTIASTIQRMLQDVVAVGADLEWLPMSAAGVTLVVSDVTMSGS
ncbi:MAG: TldD/PmbA family protein [Acidimicrobiia bacterium]|nr:TldD/PmbA family protein [Acidimicrobiia bacterium]